jgi:hypothetical protein
MLLLCGSCYLATKWTLDIMAPSPIEVTIRAQQTQGAEYATVFARYTASALARPTGTSVSPVVVNNYYSVVQTVVDPPTIQYTPTATLVFGLDGVVHTVGYSYYNPDLGGVNCADSNWNGTTCADVTASGMSWRDNVGHAVAVPPRWLLLWGFGSVIHVTSPETIVGDYIIIDKCSACDLANWANRIDRIDFLDTKQRLAWAQTVTFYLAKFVKPSP